MKKTTQIILAVTLLFAIGGCSNGGFKKTKSGILYKIITDQNHPLVKKGQFIKVNYTQRITRPGFDTVLSTSYGAIPTYAPIDSVGAVYNPAEIFIKLRSGDSAVVVMLADSLLKKQGQLPPFIHKKDKLQLTLKVLQVFNSEEELKRDQQELIDQKKVSEVRDIEQYLAAKGIKAQKTAKGVFVVIDKKGDGPAVDTGKAVHVKYRGEDFAGKVFDSNLDSSFQHPDPYVLVIGKHGAIEGWDDGLRLFNKGGKGTLYIPSMLAYGPNPPQGAPFKPFENLKFEIEVVDVTDAPAGRAPMGPQRPMQAPMHRPQPPAGGHTAPAPAK